MTSLSRVMAAIASAAFAAAVVARPENRDWDTFGAVFFGLVSLMHVREAS